ncbi:MAG: response regulator, partial [Firmicutes bacterium]|nr:response regulator [Bacillota bacterium]
VTSVYTLTVASKAKGRVRLRHMTIGFFGIAMMLLITLQVFFPLWPLYAMGYMLGTTLLHSFVVEDEKEDYRRELEEAAKRDQVQKQELSESREALKDALAIAESANKAKTAFLSNMSHEIRTPMNAIIGLNNIAMNDPTASDQVKEYLVKIGDSAQHLLGIINEILDMSRIESGRMTIKKEEFSFAKALEQVNTIISGQCRDKGLSYDCELVGKVDDYYIGDVMKLKQVMINILGNAVKFTPSGGAVRFVIEEGERYAKKAVLKFTISDTGIGMSKEFLPHIFDAFSQEDSSATSQYGSTGLGMPITKSIVELMNGHIEVASEKGKGSVFTVTVTLDESDRKQQNDEDSQVPHDMSVLVIDDNSIDLEHAQIVLGQAGISCETAGSGQEAIDKVRIRHGRREDYDLILVDWKMPGIDGVETSRQIREIVGSGSSIIILTSFNWDEIADQAKAAGVDSFVPKPLFAGSLIDEFSEAFRRRSDSPRKKTVDLKGRRVLLAEDVTVNAEIMKMVLAMRDMEADLAVNGREAVELFESHEPGYYEAILMDMRMPVMDGLEATRAIRSLQRKDAKRIPVIALTANAFDEDVQQSMQAGLNAHLSKPVEPDILFETLENLIEA